jgi:hypothetical protein
MEPVTLLTRVLKSQSIRRLLLVLASVIFSLALIELTSLSNLVDYREIIGNNFAWWPIYNISDPELIHIRRPHAHFSGTTRGGGIAGVYRIPLADMTFYQWDDKYDRNGFRNDTDLKSADIIVIGDSIVEGLTVPSSQLTTALLANFEGKVVANLGQSAYGPQQELVVLKRYGLPMRPRIVLWMFSEATDLKDVVYYDRTMRDPPDFWHAYLSRSFLRIVVHHFRTPPNPPGIRRAGFLQTSDGKRVTVYFPNSFPPLSKTDLGAIDETALIVAQAQKLSSAQGARLIFVFVPDKYRVLHEFCQFPQESECRNWTMNDMPERMDRALRAISPDVAYLDLTSSLVKAVRSGLLTHYSDDEHWSPEGHKVAAEAIRDYLHSSVVSANTAVAKNSGVLPR